MVPSDKVSVVGIGASAGGLEALLQLVSVLDPELPCAYVVLQHLSPAHRSMMVSILSRDTKLKVEEALSGTVLLPGTVYVVPATHNALIKDGCLNLVVSQPEMIPRPSINTFFMSLAAEEEQHAIGIVLSGTGSDGTSGLQAIKAIGGVTIVQSPETAKYDGMPRSAIEAGAVDHILTCEQIAAFLPTLLVPAMLEQSDDLLQRLLEMVNEKLQFDFSGYKMGMLLRRVRRRRHATGVETLAEYIDWIEKNPQELDLLARDILISVTAFFRDAKSFAALRKYLEARLEAKVPGAAIRIWVAGCATGEEAYTFAILVNEILGTKIMEHNIQIFATDLDEEALNVARRGSYTQAAVRNLPEEYLERHFVSVNGSWEVKRHLRDMVVFARHNLVSDPPFLRLDLVSCRNVLIYFDGPLQTTVLRNFHFSLNGDGLLFLGKSESTSHGEQLFSPLERVERIFLKVGGGVSVPLVNQTRSYRPVAVRRDQHTELLLRALQGRFGLTALLCDNAGNILHSIGDAERYLTFPVGAARLFIGDMMIPELRGEVLTLFHRLRKSEVMQTGRGRRINGEILQLSMMLVSSGNAANSMMALIILPQEPEVVESVVVSDDHILEEELLSTREHLHTLLEEMAASNEEMQALNEEAHAANEELQASNEELEASNEELQAANEELVSLNEELNLKSAELAKLTEDNAHLYDSLPFAVLVFDRALRLIRFNALAQQQLGVAPKSLNEHVAQIADKQIATCIEQALLSSLGSKSSAANVTLQVDRTTYQMAVSHAYDRAGSTSVLILTIADVTEVNAAHRLLRESEYRMSSLMEATGIIFAMKSLTGEFLYVNQRFLDFFGLERADVLDRTDYDVFSREVASAIWSVDLEALRNVTGTRSEHRLVGADGKVRYLQAHHRVLLSDKGRPEALIFEGQDVTAQREAAHQQRISSRLLEQTGDAILVTDMRCEIESANIGFTRISGYNESEVIGKSFAHLISDNARMAAWGGILDALQIHGSWQGELRQKNKSGHDYPSWISINRVLDAEGQPEHYIFSFSDISQLKLSQERAEYLSLHDALTGLPNRTTFQEVLTGSISSAAREGERLAVLFIDVDNFKMINDHLGHERGDALLAVIAARLRTLLKPGDIAARIGGDEFAILLPLHSLEEVRNRAQSIIDHLSQGLDLDGGVTLVGCSIGIAVYPDDGHDAGQLLRAADGAMYLAKQQGRNRYQVYNPELRHRLARRNMVESALRYAPRLDQMRLVYQPIFDISGDQPQIKSVEALLRWSEPTLGNVSPVEFIPIAEGSGQIREIDQWVWQNAVLQIKKWQEEGIAVKPVAVNVSPFSLREPAFAEDLLRFMGDHDVPYETIGIEITEMSVLENSASVIENLSSLGEAGVKISLDDFGSGYSSLHYLTRLPLSQIKIDRDFIQLVGQKRENVAITRAILGMAEALDIAVVAEGVETSGQLNLLKKEGCSMVQGHLLSRPLEVKHLEDLLMGKEDA